MRSRLSLVGWILAYVLAFGGTAAAAAPTITEIPVGSGLHGHPYDAVPVTPIVPGAPYIDLAAKGYVEREFKMSGGATVYRQRGIWSSNGRWSVTVAQTGVPYTTRLLVRYPSDPAKFNGTVVFEWLNITTGGDQDPVWSLTYEELLREGYAYVGVSPQASAMDFLHTWDPVRYAGLGSSNDGQSYDIFTQAAQAVRQNPAVVLGGLTPKRLVGMGDSQSAFRIVTYANAIQPLSRAFDGLLPVGRGGPAAPIGNGLVATSPLDAQIRTDSTTRVLQIITEGDIVELLAGQARQPDNNSLRTWELAGAAHIDSHEAQYEVATIARDVPDAGVPRCAFGTPIAGTGTPLDGINQVNDMPLYEVVSAAVAAMHKWLSLGVAPAHSPRVETVPFFFIFDVVLHDTLGNARGGIRLPEIEAPTQFYSPINVAQQDAQSINLNPIEIFQLVQDVLTTLTTTGRIDDPVVREAGLCLLSGFFLELDAATLDRLYASHADYVAKYTAAAKAARDAGFLTPADYEASIARAQAAPIP